MEKEGWRKVLDMGSLKWCKRVRDRSGVHELHLMQLGLIVLPNHSS